MLGGWSAATEPDYLRRCPSIERHDCCDTALSTAWERALQSRLLACHRLPRPPGLPRSHRPPSSPRHCRSQSPARKIRPDRFPAALRCWTVWSTTHLSSWACHPRPVVEIDPLPLLCKALCVLREQTSAGACLGRTVVPYNRGPGAACKCRAVAFTICPSSDQTAL